MELQRGVFLCQDKYKVESTIFLKLSRIPVTEYSLFHGFPSFLISSHENKIIKSLNVWQCVIAFNVFWNKSFLLESSLWSDEIKWGITYIFALNYSLHHSFRRLKITSDSFSGTSYFRLLLHCCSIEVEFRFFPTTFLCTSCTHQSVISVMFLS